MANCIWRGDGVPVAQVTTLTPSNVEVGDIFTVTINGKSISVVATDTDVATVCLLLQQALEAVTDIPEFLEVTPSNESTYVSLTAKTAGKPFTVTASAADGGGTDDQDLTVATPTASEGPNDWTTVENWEGDVVPVDGDDVYVPPGSSAILYGLDQSAVTLASLTIDQGFSGQIGLPEVNADNFNLSYDEYRDTYLKISATLLVIGDGIGTGSGRIKINTGANATAVTIRNSGTTAGSALPSILLKGTHASNTLTIVKGSVGVAVQPGESATFPLINIGYLTDQTENSNVRLGSGCTLTTIVQTGGRLEVNSSTTSVTISGGQHVCKSGTHTSITCDGGTFIDRTSGTITTLSLGPQGTADFTMDPRAKTVTNCDMFPGATLKDQHGRVTFTNGINLNRSALNDVNLVIPRNKNITLGAIS